ncbi:MAG: hypothetical protein LBJ25_01175 [Candidatus Margulisbacteria bacterium]|nr:hypothetical protein [Candidatus Margulisiibacteriota bacterium]
MGSEKTQQIEHMLNTVLKDRSIRKISFKYDLAIGDFPIVITFGLN